MTLVSATESTGTYDPESVYTIVAAARHSRQSNDQSQELASRASDTVNVYTITKAQSDPSHLTKSLSSADSDSTEKKNESINRRTSNVRNDIRRYRHREHNLRRNDKNNMFKDPGILEVQEVKVSTSEGDFKNNDLAPSASLIKFIDNFEDSAFFFRRNKFNSNIYRQKVKSIEPEVNRKNNFQTKVEKTSSSSRNESVKPTFSKTDGGEISAETKSKTKTDVTIASALTPTSASQELFTAQESEVYTSRRRKDRLSSFSPERRKALIEKRRKLKESRHFLRTKVIIILIVISWRTMKK